MSGQPGRKGHLISSDHDHLTGVPNNFHDFQWFAICITTSSTQCFSMFSKLLKCTLRVSIMQFPELLLSVLLV